MNTFCKDMIARTTQNAYVSEDIGAMCVDIKITVAIEQIRIATETT